MDMFNVDLRNKSIVELKALKKHFTTIQARATVEFEATHSTVEHTRIKQCRECISEIKSLIKRKENT